MHIKRIHCLCMIVMLYCFYSVGNPLLTEYSLNNYLYTTGQLNSSPSNLFWDYTTIKDRSSSLLRAFITKRHGEHYIYIRPQAEIKFLNKRHDLFKKQYAYNVTLFGEFAFKNFYIRALSEIDSRFKDDPSYIWHKERAVTGRFTELYSQYNYKYGFFRFGKAQRNWGPFPTRSLFLSNNTYSYDAFEGQFSLPFLEFRYLFSALPYETSIIDSKGMAYTNRYFSIHALNFMIKDMGAFGIIESVIYPRDKGFPDLKYVNPFSLYTVVSTNSPRQSGNIMVGFHGWFHPYVKNVTMKFQVLFDDFQVDDKTEFDKEPTHWAGDFALEWDNFIPLSLNHSLALHYNYASKWVYTVADFNAHEGGRYTYINKSLGTDNIDGDKTTLTFAMNGKNYWAGKLGFSIERRDTNTIHTSWNSDVSLGYTKEKKLSQRTHLTTTLSFFTEFHGYLNKYGGISLSVENRWIQKKHLGKSYKFRPRVTASLFGSYDKLFWVSKENDK